MTALLIVLVPLLGGPVLTLLAARHGITATAWAAAAVTAAALTIGVLGAPGVLGGDVIVERYRWLPALGLDPAFRIDGLSALFVLLILGVGLLVIIYARYYLTAGDPHGKFYALLMVFMGSMLGVVLAENLLLLYVFWELTSLSSFLLIGYRHTSAAARQGARTALAVTVAGGLALLAGLLLIGEIAGSYELGAWIEARAAIQAHPHFGPALLLVLLGAFTKSAQFPFHFWLPAAMAAPTPVSAYLHSATMVKAGIFLLARLYPVIGGNPLFEYLVAGTGLVTMVYAAYVAVFEHDLKGLLAYSTVSHLGLIVFLIGLDTPLSAVAAVFHVINHATFKASLFMAAGIIDHECGTRDMRRLNGLWYCMPHTATLAMAAAAAMAGVPLFNGFLSKEMFFAETLELRHLGTFGALAPYAVTLGGVLSVAYSARFIHDVFFNGRPEGLPRTPHEPPRYMKLPVEILVVIVIAVGILPAATVGGLLDAAARAVQGGPLPEYHIGLWHGLNLPLAMSAVALAGGILLYALLQRRRGLHRRGPARWTGQTLFLKLHDAAVRGATRVTDALDNGSTQRALAVTLVVVIALAAVPFVRRGYALPAVALTPVSPVALAVWLAAAAAACGIVALDGRRSIAVILSGVVGLAVALTFAAYSAPDLALTQLAVEVVTTVLLLAGLALLPPRARAPEPRSRRLRDACIALVAGGAVAALAWGMLAQPHTSIAWYYLEHSVPRGGGSNVVNVILVDFRGFDTLGEITVLGVAALGAAALLRGLQLPPAAVAPAPLLLRLTARTMLPFALLVAGYIFLRGHNQPGGGFIAGLVTAIAVVTLYMAEGVTAIDRVLRWAPPRWIGIGLGIATLAGGASLAAGLPFLTSAHTTWEVPVLGGVPLASALVFDLGVYVTVVAATLLTLVALARTRQPARAEHD